MSAISSKFALIRTRFRLLPRYQRVLAILLTIYLIFCALLGLLLPYLLHKQLPLELTALTNRPVEIEDIRINPFSLNVSIYGFALQEVDHQDFIGFDELNFEVRFWHSVFNAAVSINHVTLQNPFAFTRRLDEPEAFLFNFTDIIETIRASRAKEEAQAPTTDETGELPHVIINDILIANANFIYLDEVSQSQLHYPDIDLNIKTFGTLKTISSGEEKEGNLFSIQLVGDNGGEISTSGQIQLFPLDIIGELKLKAIKLPQLWSFISEEIQAELKSGQFNFNTQFQLKRVGTIQNPTLQFFSDKGDFSLENIEFVHESDSLINLPFFSVSGIKLNSVEKQIQVESVISEKLKLNAKLTPDGIDLHQLFMPSFIVQDELSQRELAQEKTDATITEQAVQPWVAQIGRVSLENYDLNIFEEQFTTGTQWQLQPFNLSTNTIHSDLSQPIDYQVSLSVNGQGDISSTGSVNLDKQQLDASIKLSKFGLRQLQPYLAPYINITLKSGELAGDARVTVDSPEEITVAGDIQLDKLLVKDNLHQTTLLKWQKMLISNLMFDKSKERVEIAAIDFYQPYSRIVIAEDKSTNFQDLLVRKDIVSQSKSEHADTTGSADNTTKPNPVELVIGRIRFRDGSTFFADNSLTPNFAVSVEKLEGSIDKLSSSSKHPAKLDIKGKIDKYAPVTLKGELNPLIEQPYLNLDLNLKSVELTSVNPYSGTYAGYYIDKGQLSLELSYILENNKLQGSNHMVVEQLKLGEPSNSSLATSLPVTFAIALLQDRHGVIDLGLDVSGDLDSPNFSLGNIIIKAFGNLITKAVTAPFTLLASLFGSDEELDRVSFSAGVSELSLAEKAKLNTLAKAMIDRPKLILNIKGAVEVSSDSRVMKEQMLIEKLAIQSKTEPSEMPSTLTASTFPTEGPLSDALITLYEQELGTPASEVKSTILANNKEQTDLSEDQILTQWYIALYNFCLHAQKVDEVKLGTLASARARAVKQHLIEVNKLKPSRVFLLDSRIDIELGASEAQLTLGND